MAFLRFTKSTPPEVVSQEEAQAISTFVKQAGHTSASQLSDEEREDLRRLRDSK